MRTFRFNSSTNSRSCPLTRSLFLFKPSETFLPTEDTQTCIKIMFRLRLKCAIPTFKILISNKAWITNLWVSPCSRCPIRECNNFPTNNTLPWLPNILNLKIPIRILIISWSLNHLLKKTLWFGILQLQKKEANQKKSKRKQVSKKKVDSIRKTRKWAKGTMSGPG